MVFEKISNAAERLATNVSESRRDFVVRMGQTALGGRRCGRWPARLAQRGSGHRHHKAWMRYGLQRQPERNVRRQEYGQLQDMLRMPRRGFWGFQRALYLRLQNLYSLPLQLPVMPGTG
jgi:hypothetical protein